MRTTPKKSPKANYATLTKERAEKLLALKEAARASVQVVHVPVSRTKINPPLVVSAGGQEDEKKK
jgi:hypothetical protein